MRNTTPYGPLHAGSSNTVYTVVKNNVFRSTDNGANWAITDSIPVATTTILKSFASNSEHLYVGAGSNGVFRANLNGQGWTQLSSAINGITLNTIALSAGGTMFAGLWESYGYYGGMWRSADSTASWTQINNGITNYPAATLGVNNLGYVFTGAGRGRIDRSTDGGVTFQEFSLPIPSPSYSTIITSVTSNTNGAVAFGASSGVYSSTDNGDTWARTSTVSGFQSMTTDASGNLYAGHSSGILRSTDNGQNWSSVSSISSYSILVTQAGTILAGSYNSGVYRSTDNGANWTNSGTSVVGAGTLLAWCNIRAVQFI